MHGRDDDVAVYIGVQGRVRVWIFYVATQVRYDSRAAFEGRREGIVITHLALDDGEIGIGG